MATQTLDHRTVGIMQTDDECAMSAFNMFVNGDSQPARGRDSC